MKRLAERFPGLVKGTLFGFDQIAFKMHLKKKSGNE